MRPLPALLLCLGSASCRTLVEPDEIGEELRASDVRCVVVEERFTLYSPFSPQRTERFVDATNRALDELQEAFAVEPGPPFPVHLIGSSIVSVEESPSGGETVHFQYRPRGLALHRRHLDEVRVFLASDIVREEPDGRRHVSTFEFPWDLEILRHELAHVIAIRTGLEGANWVDEGLAQLFEHGGVEDGELFVDRDSTTLQAARETWADTPLSELLTWVEPFSEWEAGRVFEAGRPLAHALAVWIVENDSGPVVERLRRFAALTPDEILAREPEFREWLRAGMPPPGDDR